MEPILSQSKSLPPQNSETISPLIEAFRIYSKRLHHLDMKICQPEDFNLPLDQMPQNHESLLQDTCTLLADPSSLPCLYKTLRELFVCISLTLEKALREDSINLEDSSFEKFLDNLESLIFFTAAVRTNPMSFSCKNHQGILIGDFIWSAKLIRKLLEYLIPNIDSTSRINLLLVRLLEVIVDPPQDFGPSKAWLTFAKQIEEEFILEDSQVCKLLSILFIILPTEARIRVCGCLQDQVIQMLDLDSISLEALNLVYFMTLNKKTQRAFISEDIPSILIEWMVECFMSRKDLSENDARKKFDTILQIFLNLVEGLEKNALDDILGMIQNRAVAHYKLYERTDIYTEIMAPLIRQIPFSGFVPVCLNFENSKIGSVDKSAQALREKEPKMFNEQQHEELQNLIQTHHFKMDSLKQFETVWRKREGAIEYDFYPQIRSAESFLLSFVFVPYGRIVKLGIYIGAGMEIVNGSLCSNPSKDNFIFLCLDNGEIQYSSLPFILNITQNFNGYSVEMIDPATGKIIITFNHGSNFYINNTLLRKNFKAYAEASKSGDTQFPTNDVNIWFGTSFFNIAKAHLQHGIYSAYPLATIFRTVFQTFRSDKQIYFVPKDFTLGEFLDLVLPTSQKALKNTLIYNQQKIITLDTKLVDLKSSSEDQNLFQIQDLYVSSSKDLKELENLASPIEVYNIIVSKHSSKIRMPLMKHLLSESGPLDAFKKITPAGNLSKDFLKAYMLITEKIGLFSNLLGSILGKDLLLILWEILFFKCEKQLTITKFLYRTILKSISPNKLYASDPEQLYTFLITAVESLFGSQNLEKGSPDFLNKIKKLLKSLRDSNLMQEPKLIGLLLEAVLANDSSFEIQNNLIQKSLAEVANYQAKIEELFTVALDILTCNSNNSTFNKNFLKLSQGVMTFMKVKGYTASLFQTEAFEDILSKFVSGLSQNSSVKVDWNMEETLVELIHTALKTLELVIQFKEDMSSEGYLLEVVTQILGLYDFLRDEIKLINDQGISTFNHTNMLREITESMTVILKRLSQEQIMLSKGKEYYKQFVIEYLTDLQKLDVAETVGRILLLLEPNCDEYLPFQIMIQILELLEVWSSHSTLRKIFDEKINDSKNQGGFQGIIFSEFCITVSKMIETSENKVFLSQNLNSKTTTNGAVKAILKLFKSIQNNLSQK